MASRPFSQAERSEFRHALGATAEIDAAALFSPGPWWGFNGVQVVVLTEDRLHVLQTGTALTAGRLRRSVPLCSVTRCHWRLRRGVRGEVTRLTFTAGGRTRTYTSKYQQGVELCARLQWRLAAALGQAN